MTLHLRNLPAKNYKPLRTTNKETEIWTHHPRTQSKNSVLYTPKFCSGLLNTHHLISDYVQHWAIVTALGRHSHFHPYNGRCLVGFCLCQPLKPFSTALLRNTYRHAIHLECAACARFCYQASINKAEHCHFALALLWGFRSMPVMCWSLYTVVHPRGDILHRGSGDMYAPTRQNLYSWSLALPSTCYWHFPIRRLPYCMVSIGFFIRTDASICISICWKRTQNLANGTNKKSHSLMAHRTEILLFSETDYNKQYFQRKIGEFL